MSHYNCLFWVSSATYTKVKIRINFQFTNVTDVGSVKGYYSDMAKT